MKECVMSMAMAGNNMTATGNGVATWSSTRQYHCNGTCETLPPTSTEERCFLLGSLQGCITWRTKLGSVNEVQLSWESWDSCEKSRRLDNIGSCESSLRHRLPMPKVCVQDQSGTLTTCCRVSESALNCRFLCCVCLFAAACHMIMESAL
jgi:hypothetical protein